MGRRGGTAKRVTNETRPEGEPTKDTRRARNDTSQPKASAEETEASEQAAKANWHANNEATTPETQQEKDDAAIGSHPI